MPQRPRDSIRPAAVPPRGLPGMPPAPRPQPRQRFPQLSALSRSLERSTGRAAKYSNDLPQPDGYRAGVVVRAAGVAVESIEEWGLVELPLPEVAFSVCFAISRGGCSTGRVC